jgi:GNAT superfamily N-acetyltransferase
MADELSQLEIKELNTENIDNLVDICVSQTGISHAETLREGRQRKKVWIKKALKDFGSCAKIAYVKGEPVGFVEFYPIQMFPFLRQMAKDRKTILITCVFVGGKKTKRLQREFQGKGIGSKLIQALIADLKQRRILHFNNEKAEEIAIGSWCSHTGFPEVLPKFRNFFFQNGFVEDPNFPDPTGKGGILVYGLTE